MPPVKASPSQSELTRYAKAMRAAGFNDLRMVIETPDGTKVSIIPGEERPVDASDEIARMIEKAPDP